MPYGPLIIVSGPSGVGKSTLLARLLAEGGLPLRLSVSATTRDPRPGEVNGVHYYFLKEEQFEADVQAGAFLEWARVHQHRYGTLRREVDEHRARGVGVLLDIDVQGAAQVRPKCPGCGSIFVTTSSFEVLESRLRGRHTESEADIELRLANARKELARSGEYDHRVINDDLATAVAQLRDLIAAQFGKEQQPCSTS
jgi:guanylate kinase